VVGFGRNYRLDAKFGGVLAGDATEKARGLLALSGSDGDALRRTVCVPNVNFDGVIGRDAFEIGVEGVVDDPDGPTAAVRDDSTARTLSATIPAIAGVWPG
jgi:hypothetical protein